MASQLPTSNINHNLILALMLNSNGRIKPHFRNLVEKSSQIKFNKCMTGRKTLFLNKYIKST